MDRAAGPTDNGRMMGTLYAVGLAMLAFVGGHFVLSSRPVRAPLVAAIGEGPFHGLYSAVAAAALVWAVSAWNAAPEVPLWTTPDWARPVFATVMLIASLLLVCALATPNPTAPRGERLLAAAHAGRGIFAVTRHPMLWAFALWAAGHLAVNGNAASLIFFGGFAALALGGMVHIDARKRAAFGADFARFEAETSLVPFAAAIAGRARISLAEIGWWRLALGAMLFALLLGGHETVIGVGPLVRPG